MASPYHHAVSSTRRWGGDVEDYLEIHRWFDASKELHGDFRHRALRHHTHGVFECERTFGVTVTLSTGRTIPTRWVAEQHVVEDLGRVPSASEWLAEIRPAAWMNRARPLSRDLDDDPPARGEERARGGSEPPRPRPAGRRSRA